MKRWLAFILLLAPIYGHATAEKCGLRAPSQAADSDLIQAATLVGEENRETEEKFSRSSGNPLDQVQAAFAASGILTCGTKETTAQVTGKNNVLTTAGHIFFDSQCNPLPESDVSTCVFKKSGASGEQEFKVDAQSLKTGKCVTSGSGDDWAVIKLTDAVEGVEPYRVPNAGLRFRENMTILTVSSFDENFNSGSRDTANLNVCSIRAVFPSRNIPLKTDCDTGHGASGGAQFALDSSGVSLNPDKLILAAINVGESNGHVDGAEYNAETQYNVSVPVTGRFLEAIKAAMQ